MSPRVRRARRSGSHDRPFGLVPSGADEGTDAVVCRLCGKTYRAITATHLRIRHDVIAAIRSRVRRGLAITAFAVQKDQQSLKHAARIYLGSWDLALRAAGLKPRPLRRAWDELGTLAAIRALQEDGGEMNPGYSRWLDLCGNENPPHCV